MGPHPQPQEKTLVLTYFLTHTSHLLVFPAPQVHVKKFHAGQGCGFLVLFTKLRVTAGVSIRPGVLGFGGKGWQGEKDVGEDAEVGQSCSVPGEEGGWKKGRQEMRVNLSINNSKSRSAGSTSYHSIRPGAGFNEPRQADMDSSIPDTGRGKKRRKCEFGAPRLGRFHRLRAAGLIQAHVSDASLLCSPGQCHL